jgi:peroxiredoxin
MKKYYFVIIAFILTSSAFSQDGKSNTQNPSETMQRVISKIESYKTISHHSEQKWGNLGDEDINDIKPLKGTCVFKLLSSDTIIKAHFNLNAENKINDFYSGDKFTRINNIDNNLTITNLSKFPREKQHVTSLMLYTGSVIGIYNMFLGAKKETCKIKQLTDTIAHGKIVQRIAFVYYDTIVKNTHSLYKKIISIDKDSNLPIHYISISKSDYGTQIIESTLSNYKINFPLKEKYFYGGKVPSSYALIEYEPTKSEAPKDQLSIDQLAPEFKLPIVQGGEFELATLKGKAVLLAFSGIHCGFCLVAVKDLIKINDDFDSERFKLISVYSDAEKNELEKYIEKKKIPYPIVFNGKGQKNDQHINDKYGVSGIPHFILLDKNGLVKWNSVGYSPDLYEVLKNEITKLVN